MQKKPRRLAAILALALLCLSFSGCAREEQTGEGYLFTTALAGSPECLDPQFTENPYAAPILTNMMEGLTRLGEDGAPVLAEAEEYVVSDGGKRYMFTLRSDCFWQNADTDVKRPEPVTARDYVFAFRRLLDPETRSPYAELFLCLKNAVAIQGGTEEVNALGVSAPDGSTLIFELETPEPDFLRLLSLPCAVPCNQNFFEGTKGRYGLDEDTVLCNGAFYLTKWNYDPYSTGNFVTLKKSTLYREADETYPSSLQFDILPSLQEAESAFAEGADDVLLTDTNPDFVLHGADATVQASSVCTMGLVFNPENLLLQEDRFREALALSIDRAALEDTVSGDVTPAYGILPPAVMLQGRSYRELLADETLPDAYDAGLAVDRFAKVAAGVPLAAINALRILVPSTITDTDALLSLCQTWQTLFGYYIGIETVSPEIFEERLASGDYSIALYGFTPEQNDCVEALRSFCELMKGFGGDPDTAPLVKVEQAATPAEAVELLGKMEKTLLEDHRFIPLFYKKTYLLYSPDNKDLYYEPFTGTLDFTHAKHFE